MLWPFSTPAVNAVWLAPPWHAIEIFVLSSSNINSHRYLDVRGQSIRGFLAKQEPREKRRLLNFLLSNCTWEDGDVVATFRQPFDLLAETAVSAVRAAADETQKLRFGWWSS
jgi:hypothetical protein